MTVDNPPSLSLNFLMATISFVSWKMAKEKNHAEKMFILQQYQGWSLSKNNSCAKTENVLIQLYKNSSKKKKI